MPTLLPPKRRLHAGSSAPHGEPAPDRTSRSAPSVQRAPTATRRAAHYSELRILVVDDDFLFSEMLPKLLRKSIAKPTLVVTGVASAEEGKRRLAAEAFDVVLSDFDLRSQETGVDVLEHAARAPKPPFRILMSGHSPRMIPKDGALDAFLDKPMTLRELVPLLTALLHERLGVEFEMNG